MLLKPIPDQENPAVSGQMKVISPTEDYISHQAQDATCHVKSMNLC